MFKILCRESRRFFALVVLAVSGYLLLAPSTLLAANLQSTATVTIAYPMGTVISSLVVMLRNDTEATLVSAANPPGTAIALLDPVPPTNTHSASYGVGFSQPITTGTSPLLTFNYNLTSCTPPNFTVDYSRAPDGAFYTYINNSLVPLPVGTLTVNPTITMIQNDLSLAYAGGGGGTVTSTPTLVSTLSGGTFPFCTPLTLHATADAYSLFTGWTGGGCSGTGGCVVPLANNGSLASITATFIPAGARLLNPSSSSHTDLLTAYNDASTGPATIQARDIPFTGDLDLNRNLDLTLQGGFNGDYTSNSGYTEIRGTLIVRNEVLTAENIVVSQ